jgi:hypothetical protein
MSLKDCSLPSGPDNSGENISILRPDGNTLLMMAFTADSARDWRTAIGESIVLLNRMSSGRPGSKKRRENLSNFVARDEATMGNSSSTMAPGAVEKNEATVQILTTAMQQHFLLNTLPDYKPVLDALKQQVAYPGDVLIWQVQLFSLLFLHISLPSSHSPLTSRTASAISSSFSRQALLTLLKMEQKLPN